MITYITGVLMNEFEFDEEMKREFEAIKVKVHEIAIEISEFSKKLKSKVDERNNEGYEKKFNCKIGDCVSWRGVRSEIVGFEGGMPNVSVYVTRDSSSGISHKINDIKEISEWKRI